MSLELSTARPSTFRGVYGITRDTMNNSGNEIYYLSEFLLCLDEIFPSSSLKISQERIGARLGDDERGGLRFRAGTSNYKKKNIEGNFFFFFEL